MTEIFSRIKLNTREIVATVVFVVTSVIAQMVIPSMLSKMIDDGVSGKNAKLVITIGISMFVLSVIACALNIVATRLAAAITTKFSADVRKELFYKIQGFSAAEIDKFGTASLITRNTTDVTMIQNFISQLLSLGLLAPIMAVVGVTMSIVFAGKIAVVLAVAVPVLLIVVTIIIVTASRYSIKLRKKIDDINRLFLEALEGVRVIRAFNKQAHEINRFDVTNTATAKISQKSIATSGWMLPSVSLIFGITSIGAMVMGSTLVVKGEMDVGALVAATQYITTILLAIILLSSVVSLFPDTYACMKRIGEVLKTEVSIKDSTKEMPPKTCHGTVEFKNVTFAYPGADAPVIKGISFVSRPGETTAIIGRTGCGKSSIVKMIPRLYDTLFGEVLVDGVNVRDYKL